jgi:hypothetical protein
MFFVFSFAKNNNKSYECEEIFIEKLTHNYFEVVITKSVTVQWSISISSFNSWKLSTQFHEKNLLEKPLKTFGNVISFQKL